MGPAAGSSSGPKGPYKLKAAPLSESIFLYRKVVGSKRHLTITPEDAAKHKELVDLKFTAKARLNKIIDRRGTHPLTDFSFNIDKGLVTFRRKGLYETKDLFALCSRDKKLEKIVADFKRVAIEIAGVHSRSNYLRSNGTIGRRGGPAPLARSNPILQALPQDSMSAAREALALHDQQHASSPLAAPEKAAMQRNVARTAVAYKHMKEQVDKKVERAETAFNAATRPGPAKDKLEQTLNHWKGVQSDLGQVDCAALMMGAAYAPQVRTAAAADAQARKLFSHFNQNIDQKHEDARGYAPSLLSAVTPDRWRDKEDKIPLDRSYAADVAALPYFALSPEEGLSAYDGHYHKHGMRAKENGMTGLVLGSVLRDSTDGINDAWVKTLPAVIQAEVRAMIGRSLAEATRRAPGVMRALATP
jgi:hypothetical protein